MDGISSAASILAVCQLAQAVSSTLKDYYESVRDARKDIQQVYQATQSLKATLDILDKLSAGRNSNFLSSDLFKDPCGVLQQCFKELWDLKEKLPSKGNAGTRQKLKWPFQKSEINKAVEAIEKHKSTLNLQIGLDNLHSSLVVFDIMTEIRAEIEVSRNSDRRQNIVTWLLQSVPKPSVEHHQAREKHEETTGSWLIEGPELEKWKATRNSLLWLNGGPGTGKSILCSTAIEHFKQLCTNNPRSIVSYWYFTFADSEKQEVSNFLLYFVASMVSNCRIITQEFFTAYEKSNYGLEKPGKGDLILMFKSLIHGFDDIFIFVDALDECPKEERVKFFDRLEDILSWGSDSLHFLITSRGEVDIQESFESITSTMEDGEFQIVSIQGSRTQHDIQKFLKHSLESRRFRFWKPQLREDVQQYLASKADGMFRLVSLELEALSKLRSETRIRDAMKELPKSLDKFYQRILGEIAEEDYNFAHNAFRWLAFALRPLYLNELAIAMAINTTDHSYQGESLDLAEVLDILPSGLVKVYNETEEIPNQLQNHSLELTKIQFAHFSVKEYLLSTRIVESSVAKYQLTEMPAYHTFAEQCIIYLLHVGQTNEPSSHGFFWYAASYWARHFEILEKQSLSSTLLDRALDFLEVASPAWAMVMRIYSPPKLWLADAWQATPQDWANTIWNSRRDKLPSNNEILHPLIFVTQFGLNQLVLLILSKISDVNEIPMSEKFGGALHFAARGGHYEIVHTLLAKGAYIDSASNYCGTALYETAQLPVTVPARQEKNLEICRLLLKEGAHINIETGGSFPQFTRKQSPLIGAIQACNTEIVQLLLENGAEPNSWSGTQYAALEIAVNGQSSSRNFSIIQVLLEHGADVNITSESGSLLHKALRLRDLETVSLLLKFGADVHSSKCLETISSGGRTFSLPLSQHVMAQVTNKFLKVNWIMESPTSKFWRNGSVIEILLQASADPRQEGLWAHLLELKKNNNIGWMTSEQFSMIENKVKDIVKKKLKEKRKVWLRNQEYMDMAGDTLGNWKFDN